MLVVCIAAIMQVCYLMNSQSSFYWNIASPSFTAFCIAQVHSALYNDPSWRNKLELSSDDVAWYRDFSQACIKYGFIFRLLNKLPYRTKVWLFGNVLFYGMAQHYVARKKYIEKTVIEAFDLGVDQIVNLGAGFDTLCIRFAKKNPEKIFFEIDHPDTQNVKLWALQKAAYNAPNIHFFSHDFVQHGIGKKLRSHPSFDVKKPVCFILEGVTVYLDAEQNAALFRSMKDSSDSSVSVAFGAVEVAKVQKKIIERAVETILRVRSENYQWKIDSDSMPEFLLQSGFELKDYMSYAKLQRDFRSDEELKKLSGISGENYYYAVKKP